MSFSCSKKEKMPLYLLRQLSVMTMLTGQPTCGGGPSSGHGAAAVPAPSHPHLGPC